MSATNENEISTVPVATTTIAENFTAPSSTPHANIVKTTTTTDGTTTTTATIDIAPPLPPNPTTQVTTVTITTSDDIDSAIAMPTTKSENNNGNALAAQQQQQQQMLEMQATDKGKMDVDASLTNFKMLYVVAQLCGLTMVVLMGTWIGVHMGGLSGTDNPKLEFNWHPLLMTIGLIFLYGNSILIYRGFRTLPKKTLKLTHAGIHLAAFILTVFGLVTVFDSHNLAEPPIPNMYSFHSWLGLATVILFGLQYVAGFAAFLFPVIRESYRVALMPMHIYFGLLGFVMAIATALMGMTEKAIFSIPSFSSLPNAQVLGNIICVLYVVFGGIVVYLATELSYKRKPMPEDTVLLTGNTE